jgi:Tfp pilus assembly protein PilV
MKNNATVMHAKFRRLGGAQDGVTILETLIAMSVLLVVSVGILAMGMVAMTTTENQGHRPARTAEHVQDKAEQLLSLASKNPSSDTTVFPTADTGGSTPRNVFYGWQMGNAGLTDRMQPMPPSVLALL